MSQAPEPAISLAAQLVAELFATRGDHLLVGGISVADLAAEFGTPLFVYDAALMRVAYRQLRGAVEGFAQVYFSAKANPNPAILRVFVTEGAGLEIASGAEYLRAQAAGCRPQRILFAGPGKRDAELTLVLREGIGEIHLESYEEIDRIDKLASALQRRAPVGLRVNPLASAQGGAMQMGGRAAQFGFDEETIESVVDAVMARPSLELLGVHLFAGTQILDANVLAAQWRHGLIVARRIAERIGKPLATIDLGGGLGIPYFGGDRTLLLNVLTTHVASLAGMVCHDSLLRGASIIIEPGRYLVGPAGVYVARVHSAKTSRGTRFIVTDGGMHHHLAASGNLGQFIKRDYPIVAADRMDSTETANSVVVGPLCTPLDTIGREASLPQLKPGNLVALLQSGAYALTASPNGFLSHPMPAEILVDSGQARIIREPGSFAAPLSQLPLDPSAIACVRS
jgi:diaminopimelate decarboxylase